MFWGSGTAGSRLDPRGRYTTKACPAEVQCVVIQQSELAYPTVGIISTTSVGADIIRSSTITLDTSFGRTNSAARTWSATRGPRAGLKHRATTKSCMNSYVTSTRYPDKTDIKNLHTMYGYR